MRINNLKNIIRIETKGINPKIYINGKFYHLMHKVELNNYIKYYKSFDNNFVIINK